MQSHTFFGGNQDSINIALADEAEVIQLPAGLVEKETYIRDTLRNYLKIEKTLDMLWLAI